MAGGFHTYRIHCIIHIYNGISPTMEDAKISNLRSLSANVLFDTCSGVQAEYSPN